MTNSKPSSHHRWLYIPWAIAAVIFTAYFVLWRTGAHEMKKAVSIWVEDQQAAGLDVRHGALIAEGFPFFLRVHIETPMITAPTLGSWRTERLTIDVLPYDLNRIIFSTRAEQRITISAYGEFQVTADDFRISISNDKKRDWALAATIKDATAVHDKDNRRATLGSLIFDLAPDATDKTTLTLNLLATDAKIAANDGETLSLDKIQTVLATTQTHTLGDKTAWRNAGGELLINGFFAQLEDARFAASGSLSLDGNGHPIGALKTETIAPAAFIRLLGKAGAMSSDEAESAAASLTLATIAAGGKLTTPIELKEGAAYMAGVKLTDLP